MKLYRPVLIESAEHAERLPEGTPATAEHDFVRERCSGGWTGGDGETLYVHIDMIGFTALVPIEAEEEPTDAEIEAAAEGMWDRYGNRGMWKHAPDHLRRAFRADARAALSAASAARGGTT